MPSEGTPGQFKAPLHEAAVQEGGDQLPGGGPAAAPQHGQGLAQDGVGAGRPGAGGAARPGDPPAMGWHSSGRP